MNVSCENTTRIHSIATSLEAARNDLSAALVKSANDTNVEHFRLEDLHRRVTSALSALHGEARDW